MEIGLSWTAAMAELRFMRSLVKIEIAEVTEIVKITVMILVSEEWLFEAVLSLIDTALAVATI